VEKRFNAQLSYMPLFMRVGFKAITNNPSDRQAIKKATQKNKRQRSRMNREKSAHPIKTNSEEAKEAMVYV
jgi:hypothetical protein